MIQSRHRTVARGTNRKFSIRLKNKKQRNKKKTPNTSNNSKMQL